MTCPEAFAFRSVAVGGDREAAGRDGRALADVGERVAVISGGRIQHRNVDNAARATVGVGDGVLGIRCCHREGAGGGDVGAVVGIGADAVADGGIDGRAEPPPAATLIIVPVAFAVLLPPAENVCRWR